MNTEKSPSPRSPPTCLSHQHITVSNILQYTSQSGPYDPKHGGGCFPTQDAASNESGHGALRLPRHPTMAFLLHYAIIIPCTFFAHDLLVWNESSVHDEDNIRQTRVGLFAFTYVSMVCAVRYTTSAGAGRLRQHAVLYEFTWLCNSALLIGALGFFSGRPVMATGAAVAVSIDQVLWYVDLMVWLVSGKFPIGVAKYLTWKQTQTTDRFTCTHHLWTIPLFIYGANGLQVASYLLSVCIVVGNVLLSRWLTPSSIQLFENTGAKQCHDSKTDSTKNYRYLNVNLSHELWRDISFGFLQISKDDPPCAVYIFRLLWRWQLFNGLIFIGILHPLSQLIGA